MTIDSMAIPLIDLSPWTDTDPSNKNKYSPEDRLQVVQQIQQACRDIGFFAVQHHAVDETVMDAAWTASRDFFDLPMDIKLQSKSDDEKVYPYGYEHSENLTLGKESTSSGGGGGGDKVAVVATGTAITTATPTPADLKETFSMGSCNPDAGVPPRRFPAQPATFQPALENYYAAMEDLAALLLRIFAMALDLPPDWFQDKTDHHMSALRVLNYFAVDSENDNVAVDHKDDQQNNDVPARPLRAGAHTDYGALTILKSGGPGLQVKKDVVGGGKDEHEWVDVPDLPNSYIINLGDLMQQWTNGTYILRSCHATYCT
jgi:isopenicillin N synthase-like dioxygenase